MTAASAALFVLISSFPLIHLIFFSFHSDVTTVFVPDPGRYPASLSCPGASLLRRVLLPGLCDDDDLLRENGGADGSCINDDAGSSALGRARLFRFRPTDYKRRDKATRCRRLRPRQRLALFRTAVPLLVGSRVSPQLLPVLRIGVRSQCSEIFLHVNLTIVSVLFFKS